MKKTLKWTGKAALVLGVLVAFGVIAVYALSSWKLAERYDVPRRDLALEIPAAEPAVLAAGERLAVITGCTGCHGRAMAGQVYIDIPNVARLVAPNLMQVAARASDAELVRSIRYGIKLNGQSVLGMPSEAFHHLTDEDLAAIIAYIRAQPMQPPPEIDSAYHFLVRLGLVLDRFDLPAETIRDEVQRMPAPDRNDPLQLGGYLAQIACAECHGRGLDGNPEMNAPSLAIVRGYSRTDFATLMTRGKALGDREVGLMSRVTRDRFGAFTSTERDALFDYLSALGD
jgi:cytochrome c553